MDIAFVLIILLALFLALVTGYLVGIWRLVQLIFEQWHSRRWAWRLAAIAGVALFTASHYVACKALSSDTYWLVCPTPCMQSG